MDSRQQLIVDVVSKVSEGKMGIVNATKLLNNSRGTVDRYLKKYRQTGIKFIVHQNTGKSPPNKTCDDFKRTVQKLIKEKYFDVNLTYLAELMEDRENIRVKLKLFDLGHMRIITRSFSFAAASIFR